MAEVVSDANAGRKRHLPAWMQGVSAADKPRNSGMEDEKCMLEEEQSETKAAKSKVKPIAGKPDRRIPTPETDGSERAENSQRYAAKHRTRKVSRRDDGPSNSVISCDETGLPKKKLKKERGGRIVHKRAASTKQNQRSCGPKNSEVEAIPRGSSGDEIELTVEDLVSIAEEYVNADREKQHGWSARRESNSETHPSTLPIPSKANLRGPNEAAGCSQSLSRCTTTRCSSHLNEIGRKEKESPTTENFATNAMSTCTTAKCSSDLSEIGRKEKEISTTDNFTTNIVRTGDAAQDMLDLFLGPLLKKPPQEQDPRITKTDIMALVHESNKQVKSMAEWNDEALLTKKKSSLKDKVNMFLN